MQDVNRRRFLMGAAAATAVTAGGIILPNEAQAGYSKHRHRSLKLHNLHTDEKLDVTYYTYGRYQSDALAEINYLLRDHRSGDIARIDPHLLDLLYVLNYRMEGPGEFEVFSAYRSPKSNQFLQEHSSGVATNSLHMQGRAMDVRTPGKQLSYLHKAAISLEAGGVGYYPSSGFVHVDTGRFRTWGGA